MKSGLLARLLVALPIAGAHAAAAQTVASGAEPTITVTAARTASLEALGGTAINRAQIEALAPTSALDALDRVAGVRALSTGGVAGGTFLSVRGGEPNFTLTLIEGAKVNDPTNSAGGAFDYAQIDPALIDRIEVFRGALSAVHGADALSGVVNLKLRAPVAGERTTSARVTASSGGEVGGDASAALGWSGGGLLLGGGAYDSGDLDAGGHLARRQGLGRVTGEAGGVKLAALGLYSASDRRVFPEDSGGPRLAVLRGLDRRATEFALASVEATAANPGALIPTVRASWSRQGVDDDTPPIAPGVLSGVPRIRAVSAFERTEAGFDLRYTHGPLSVDAGAGWLGELGTGHGFVDFGRFKAPADFRLRREVASGFVEATLAPAHWATLTASARYDSPSTVAARWTGRVAARVTPVAGGPALFADYSEGFKLPSIFALAYPLIANPTLRPERARSVEAGADWQRGGRRLRVAAFATRYADLIDFDAVRFTNVNRSRVDARGVEAEAAVPLSATLAATGAVTYLDTTNFSGPPLRTRPDWHGSARLTWTPSAALSAFADLDTVSPAFDLSVPTGQIRTRGHSELGVGGGYRIARGLSVDVALRNLTDRRYEDAVGFPNPGRVLRASLRLTR